MGKGEYFSIILTKYGEIYVKYLDLSIGSETYTKIDNIPPITKVITLSTNIILLDINGKVHLTHHYIVQQQGWKRFYISFLPIELPYKVIDVVSSSHHTLFLCENGTVYGCGDNSEGQLG